MPTKIYTNYDPPPKVRLECKDKSLTRQSEAAACDINKIVERYDKTGLLPIQDRPLFYADVSMMTDYQSAVNQVNLVTNHFMQLPAKVRSQFNNDPAAFLDFCADPQNRDQMRDMGLIEKEENDAPVAPPDAAADPPPDPPA